VLDLLPRQQGEFINKDGVPWVRDQLSKAAAEAVGISAVGQVTLTTL
jgi:hypothetical protein